MFIYIYKANGLGGLEGIDEHYIYFKYVIRGDWEDIQSAEFLYDFKYALKYDDGDVDGHHLDVEEDLQNVHLVWDQYWFRPTPTKTIKIPRAYADCTSPNEWVKNITDDNFDNEEEEEID